MNKITTPLSAKKMFIIAAVLVLIGAIDELTQLVMYPLLPLLRNGIHLSTDTFELIIGIFFLGAFLGSLISFALAKNGRLANIMLISVFISVVGLIASICSHGPVLFILARLLLGIGAGILCPIGATCIMTIFAKDRVFTLGFIKIIINPTFLFALSGVFFAASGIFTIGISTLIAYNSSWIYAFILALALVVLYGLVLCYIRKDLNQHTSVTHYANFFRELIKLIHYKKMMFFIIGRNFFTLATTGVFVVLPSLFIDTLHLKPQTFTLLYIVTIIIAIAGSITIGVLNSLEKYLWFCMVVITLLAIDWGIFLLLSYLHFAGWLELFIILCVSGYLISLSGPPFEHFMMLASDHSYVMASSSFESLSYVYCWISSLLVVNLDRGGLMAISIYTFSCIAIGYLCLCVALLLPCSKSSRT